MAQPKGGLNLRMKRCFEQAIAAIFKYDYPSRVFFCTIYYVFRKKRNNHDDHIIKMIIKIITKNTKN